MPEEIKEIPLAPASTPKSKPPKPEKVKLRLTGAGSCNYDGLILRKGETIELEASRAEQLIKSGLFEKS